MIRSKLQLPALLLASILFFSACHRVPKHVRYIPKDAFMVLGVHTGEMRKELAWSAITGSGLLEELRKAGANDQLPAALKDLDQSGIDFSSTLYFYAKPDTRFAEGMRLGGVLPLSDAEKLKSYLTSHFPGLAIREAGGRSEVFMDKKVCISWNDDLVIAMNTAVNKVTHDEPARVDTIGGTPIKGEPYAWTEEQWDSAATSREMAAAFQPAKASGIDENNRFTALEKAGHDISFWMSYDGLMDLYNSSGQNNFGVMGTSIGNSLFKGSAMASGFDFEKGRIDGVMRYYASDSMKPVAREFAKENVDGDMLRRLPAPGLNMAAGYHLSPAVIKLMLEKMNLSGVANLALMAQGLTMDDMLGGFTGDMVLAINNFHVSQEIQQIDSNIQKEYSLTPLSVSKPVMDFVFALKIGDRAKLNKLINLIGKSGALQQTAPNTFRLTGAQGGTLVIGEKYIAASSNEASAQAFLREHAGAMPDAVHKEISGHPIGMWADLQSFMAGAATITGQSSSDSAGMAIVRNTFTTLSMNGGEIKHEANEYRMSLGFTDKNESSLLQLLRMAQKLAVAQNKGQQVSLR